MRQTRFALLLMLLLVMSGIAALPTSAGAITLINNSGSTSTSWYIEGEPTLVMNGFDLTPLNLSYPVTIDTVTIAVQQPVSETVQVVIYEDGNGGSPVDATLLSQTPVLIQTAGVATIVLPTPVTTNAPVIWVGFYLPVGFRFFADESGSSVLTYWGWTDGGTFDLASLGTAGVLGPADGTAPVNVNLGGIARITAEINQTGGTLTTGGTGGLGSQIAGDEAPLNLLRNYPYCGEAVFYDPQDISVSGDGRFTTHCRADLGPFSPGVIRNASQLPGNAADYERRGFLYEVFAAGDYQADPQDSERWLVPVTHCIRPQQADLNTAFIGIAYGAPREWEILPTQRYGELICAEVTHQGFFSYFVPRTVTNILNADLYFSGYPYFEAVIPEVPLVGDNDMFCGYNYILYFSVHNEGFAPTPATTVRLQLRNDRTGVNAMSRDVDLRSVQPGETVNMVIHDFAVPTTYVWESHTLNLIIDPNNGIQETNEDNNVRSNGGIIILESNNCKQ